MNEMDIFEFSQFPEEAHSGHHWKIFRTPPKAAVNMYVISTVPVGVITHYWHGQTTGHLRTGCKACADGNQIRWTGYLLALSASDKRRILFEFSKAAGIDLKCIIETHGVLRGLALSSIRPNGRNNGRVTLASKGLTSQSLDDYPDEPIEPILKLLWHVNEAAPTVIVPTTDTHMSEAERVYVKARLKPPGGKPKMRPPMPVDELVQPDLFSKAMEHVNGYDPLP